jgi:hypothetical protein
MTRIRESFFIGWGDAIRTDHLLSQDSLDISFV